MTYLDQRDERQEDRRGTASVSVGVILRPPVVDLLDNIMVGDEVMDHGSAGAGWRGVVGVGRAFNPRREHRAESGYCLVSDGIVVAMTGTAFQVRPWKTRRERMRSTAARNHGARGHDGVYERIYKVVPIYQTVKKNQ